jgi:two-component system phosphate regulon sensor histidine kinase PhoR
VTGRDSPLALAALVIIAVVAVAVLPTALAVVAAAAVVLTVIAVLRSPEPATAPVESPAEAPIVSPLDDPEALIRPLDEGVLLLAADLTVVGLNPAAAAIVDRPIDSMAGVSLIQAVRDHEIVDLARETRGVRAAIHLSASDRDVLASATAVQWNDVRIVLCVRDVTELLHAQRARSELVANVSHELRTPIAAARALAETLHAGVEEAEDRERFLARLAQELERLGDIVQRLLRLARLESGAETFEIGNLDTQALLEEAASRIAPVADRRRVPIEVTPPDGPVDVEADRDRVLEVLSNLLDNAVRHSPDRAPVQLRAVADGTSVRFEVADRGPGILPVDRERVFERFYTGERSRTPGAGSGLGLAIARHIVQRLGGRIWIADHNEPGALICFTLPRSDAMTSGHTR